MPFFRAAALLVGLAAPSVGAAQAPMPLLVDAAWVTPRLADPDLVLLHVAFEKAEYDAGHLPGARFVPFAAYAVPVSRQDSLRTELPPIDSLQRVLVRAGVTDRSRVVVIGQPIAAARLLFTLAVLGLDGRAGMLDGGVEAWREAGRPLTRDVPVVTPGTLTVTPDLRWLARADDVRAAVRTGSPMVLDARLPEFYFGYSANGFPRAGHVAGAGNVPFATLTRELGRLRDPGDLDRLLSAAGAPKGTPVVTYCHVGQQASLLWFAARLAGRPARMYDGSFQEWSRLADAPVTTSGCC
ncbi:MAG: rhodanese-like domain-containing protein [Gemmatimonadaceae bacterium]|nr:rhodanese-like domain-containing protein [Gemmatimonadaceae bacterium]